MLKNPGSLATIQDVASEAKVSISTVSNVLNGRQHRMRAETLERVNAAIAALGFRPNQSARRLKTGHMPMLGLLVPSIANPFYGTLARWIESAAREKGYGVTLCNTDRDPAREREYAEAFLAQGIRGVISGSALRSQDPLRPVIERGLMVVSFDRAPDDESDPMDTVCVDNRRAGAMAIEHLLELGHRRIAYATGELSSQNRIARLEGAQQACAKAGVHLLVESSTVQLTTAEFDLVEMGRDIGLAPSLAAVTAVVGMNDMLAIGLLAGLREADRAVPQDISVVGIDDLTLGRFMSPPLTTVRQPLKVMAQAAVERILIRLEQPDAAPSRLVFMPELVVRQSSARL